MTVTDAELSPAERRKKIGDRLDEFFAELKESENIGDQFQVGYYVHAEEVRWLLDQHTQLLKYAEQARAWMLDEFADDLPRNKRLAGIRIRINIEGMTRRNTYGDWSTRSGVRSHRRR